MRTVRLFSKHTVNQIQRKVQRGHGVNFAHVASFAAIVRVHVEGIVKLIDDLRVRSEIDLLGGSGVVNLHNPFPALVQRRVFDRGGVTPE